MLKRVTSNQQLSEKFNKLIDEFEKRNKCFIKDLNFTICIPKKL